MDFFDVLHDFFVGGFVGTLVVDAFESDDSFLEAVNLVFTPFESGTSDAVSLHVVCHLINQPQIWVVNVSQVLQLRQNRMEHSNVDKWERYIQ